MNYGGHWVLGKTSVTFDSRKALWQRHEKQQHLSPHTLSPGATRWKRFRRNGCQRHDFLSCCGSFWRTQDYQMLCLTTTDIPTGQNLALYPPSQSPDPSQSLKTKDSCLYLWVKKGRARHMWQDTDFTDNSRGKFAGERLIKQRWVLVVCWSMVWIFALLSSSFTSSSPDASHTCICPQANQIQPHKSLCPDQIRNPVQTLH